MNRIVIFSLSTVLFVGVAAGARAQRRGPKQTFSRADSLRGTLNAERSWYNVLRYDLTIAPDYDRHTIEGSNRISYAGTGGKIMQIDLQEPLIIDSIMQDGQSLSFTREGNAFHVNMVPGSEKIPVNITRRLTVYYHGSPVIAVTPPWDGGWIFGKDSLGRPWMTVACEGVGASIWYPCKDWLGDEPDSGASLSIIVPDTLMAVGNGRLISTTPLADHKTKYKWAVVNPINNYNIIPYIGKYVHWHEDYRGSKGRLDMDYWVLDYAMARARKQFSCADSMMTAFEHWFGPYPFYEDGYKLVQSSHLGMEHQSNVAYGNNFQEGYRGKDLSASGWGLKWDFIIVHESGHEWFGNSITCKDIADEWIHEGFTAYSECLYTGYYFGSKAGDEYVQGVRKLIKNKTTIIGTYGVNQGPQGTDEYYKGSNMLHTLRQIVHDDNKFRALLQGLQKTFYHQTVSTAQIEKFLTTHSGINLGPFFDQYLRSTNLPELEYRQHGYTISYRWTNCNADFAMPLKVNFKGDRWIKPSLHWKEMSMYPEGDTAFSVDPNFYISVKKVP